MLAAIAVLASVLAYWTWNWLAPRPLARAPQRQALSLRLESAYGLFGSAQRQAAANGDADIRLLGVVAGAPGRSGYAVLRVDAKRTVAVAQGDEVKPGIRLVEVLPNRVVLSRNGRRETLTWPRKSSPAVALPMQRLGR